MNAIPSPVTARPGVGAPHRNGFWSLLLDAPGAAVSAAIERLVSFHTTRKAIAHLRSLPDHCLKDIGLDRSEIPAAVHGFDRDHTRRRWA